MEGESRTLSGFVRIAYAGHVFYMQKKPANVFINDSGLEILMEDMNSYIIVDGVRCYYHLQLEVGNQLIHTFLKDFTIDGTICQESFPFSFPINAKEFPFSNRRGDTRVVVPKRDYSELVSAFIAQYTELDIRITDFLRNYPETFELASMDGWIELSDCIDMEEFDQKSLERILEDKAVVDLFSKEVLGK